MLRRAWDRISHIGVKSNLPDYKQRGIILSNQISAILLIAVVISFIYMSRLGDPVHFINAFSMIVLSLLVMAMNRLKFINASRLLASIFPPLIIYLVIVLRIPIQDISLIYYTYIILAFCVVPVLVFDVENEKLYLFICLAISFSSLAIYDRFLISFLNESSLSNYFMENALVIKIPLLEVWFILVFAMLFLKKLNSKYEEMLHSTNAELISKHEEVLQQMEELSVANEELLQQQEQIVSQRDFIENRNKELKEYQDKLLDYVYRLSQSKDQLTKKEAENVSILNALRQNFIMAEFDLDGTITWIAPKTLAYLGLTNSDIIGSNSKDLIRSIDERYEVKEPLAKLWTEVLSGQSVSADLELDFKGNLFHLSITYAPIMNGKNKPYKILAIAEDISDVTNQKKENDKMNKVLLKQQTEIKDQNERLQQQTEEISAMNETLEDRVKERTTILEQKNKQLAEYAFINAHLLRAPVSSILGLINLLEYEKLSKEEKEIYHYLKKSINQLDKIVFKINKAIQQNKEIDREFLRE